MIDIEKRDVLIKNMKDCLDNLVKAENMLDKKEEEYSAINHSARTIKLKKEFQECASKCDEAHEAYIEARERYQEYILSLMNEEE